MRNQNYRAFIFLWILIIAVSACEKDSGPIIIKPETPVDTSKYYISFKGYIQPILNDYCIGCHTSNHPFLDLRGAVSYDELVYTGANAPYVDSLNPDNSLLIQRLLGDEWPVMPPDAPYLSPSDIDSIRFWMSQGYRDN